MSRMTNPDNGMMENQQASDVGHTLNENEAPSVEGAAVESPIPHLPDGVNADGMVESAHEEPNPDPQTEDARKSAIEIAAAQSASSD